ncbi:MAG TPA: PAS domain-containing protein [Burkholderiales bacterium]|nr:PAS domain-containing protein [Burkholderiales bacterium]
MAQELEELRIAWLGLKARVEQLAAERQQYLEFFEQAAEAYVVTASDGRIVEANGAAVDVLQCRRGHLLGKPLAVFVALDRRLEFRGRLAAIARRAPAAEPGWRTVLASRGERIEVRLTARVIERPDGGICWRLEPTQ